MTDLINWTKVLELRDEIGAEDFDEVVELFLEEVDETISHLGKPGRSLEHDLHFLKGSALNLGFQQFSDLCKTGEDACVNGQGETVNCQEVLASYDRSKGQFLAELQVKLAA